MQSRDLKQNLFSCERQLSLQTKNICLLYDPSIRHCMRILPTTIPQGCTEKSIMNTDREIILLLSPQSLTESNQYTRNSGRT